MASLAEALQVAYVRKQRHVATVRDNVVHHRGLGPAPSLGADPAERLPEELIRPEIIRPQRQAVQLVPLGGLSPLCLWLLVLGAVPGLGQGSTPRVPTWPERLLSHGLSPPGGKTKSQHPTNSPRLGNHVGHWLKEHWPQAISTICTVLQWRHQSCKWVATVSGLTAWLVLRLHVGQTTYPSLMLILPHCTVACNVFSTFLAPCSIIITGFKI